MIEYEASFAQHLPIREEKYIKIKKDRMIKNVYTHF